MISLCDKKKFKGCKNKGFSCRHCLNEENNFAIRNVLNNQLFKDFYESK